MVAKTEKSQAMIEKILSTATHLFIHNGYEKTSVQNIAQTASISKGAIYHHFQSKDEIFFEVLKQRYQLMEKELLDWLESTSHLTGREQLKETFRFSLKSQKTNYEMLNHAPLDAEFMLTIIRYNLRIGTPLIADIIKKGIEDQSIQPIPFPNEAAETILLLTNFWVEGSIFENSSEKIVERIYFLQFMLQSIGLDIFDESLIQEILSQSN